MRPPNRHAHPRPSEEGSVTVWMITASWAMIILVGLAVDLSGQVYAQQRARAVAAQAARAGGEQIQTGTAIQGGPAHLDTATAAAAARAYLAAAHTPGTVTLTTGDTLTVTTSSRYPTRFLSIIGIGSLPVTGHSTARLIRAQNGAPR